MVPRSGKSSLLFEMSREESVGPTQPPVQWVSGLLSGVYSSGAGRGVTLTTPLHLALRFKTSGTVPLFPPTYLNGVGCVTKRLFVVS